MVLAERIASIVQRRIPVLIIRSDAVMVHVPRRKTSAITYQDVLRAHRINALVQDYVWLIWKNVTNMKSSSQVRMDVPEAQR